VTFLFRREHFIRIVACGRAWVFHKECFRVD
jgi:hypothetical protein